MDERFEPYGRLSTEELTFLNCGVREDSQSPLDFKEIKPVNTKGNQPWIFIKKTYAKAEAPIIWPPNGKSQLIRKESDYAYRVISNIFLNSIYMC